MVSITPYPSPPSLTAQHNTIGNAVPGIQNNAAMWSIEVASEKTVVIKDHHRKFLTTAKNGEVKTNRDTSTTWEWREGGPGEICLKGSNGKWLSCNRAGIATVDRGMPKSFEKWKVVEVTNKFYLRCCSNGGYLGVNMQTGQVHLSLSLSLSSLCVFLSLFSLSPPLSWIKIVWEFVHIPNLYTCRFG